MKPRELRLPLAVFVASLAATVAAMKYTVPRAGDLPPMTVADSPSGGDHREDSSFSEVRAFLRAGDIGGATASLRRLGERDPVAFFELLAKLPGMPGMDDLIRHAAARLPWKEPAVADLLNRIGPHDWRDLAWEAYTAARVGLRPDEEVFEIGGQARSHTFLSGTRALMEDAAEKRPDGFLAFLNRKGGTSIREEFFKMLMKHHPERAGELYRAIPDGSPGCNDDRRYILQARVQGLPTAENLQAVWDELGNRGSYSSDLAPALASHAYLGATPAEREKVLDLIAAQAPLARNRMLAALIFQREEPVSAGEFCRLVGIYTSASLQREALEIWLSSGPDPGEDDWLEKLPSEKLRNHARALLGGP